jgi:dephospho-CoA kinase
MRRAATLLALASLLFASVSAEARFRYRPAAKRSFSPRCTAASSGCRVIGLTGGIASGKSTVSRMFKQLGARVVDADKIARRIVAPGKPALREIAQTFGKRMVRPDGTLDRIRLGQLVFSDPAKLKQLDAITHPRIAAAAKRSIARHRRAGAPLVIYDAALIVEKGWHKGLDGLVVVSIPEKVQLSRLMQRDGTTRAGALKRVRSQLPLADKVKVADHVIDNSGSLNQTRSQVERLYKQLTATPVVGRPK